MAAIDDLTSAIGNLETEAAAVVTLLGTLNDSSALEALTARVTKVTSDLTAAATPAAPSAPAA